MRKKYETAVDRKNENMVIELIKKTRPDFSFRKTSQLSLYDFDVFDVNGRQIGILEIKTRKHKFGTFNTLNISRKKIAGLIAVANAKRLNAFLCISWDDMVGALTLKKEMLISLESEKGGRVDRDDPHDIEQMLYVPIKDFTII